MHASIPYKNHSTLEIQKPNGLTESVLLCRILRWSNLILLMSDLMCNSSTIGDDSIAGAFFALDMFF